MAYIVMTSSAHMPTSCKGRYRNVAVVEVEDGIYPKMISTHAKGVRSIVRHFGPQNCGTTDKCAYRRTLVEAAALVESLT